MLCESEWGFLGGYAMNSNTKVSRRSVLAAGAAAVTSPSLSFANRPAPSERITIGVIGLGGRGRQVMNSFLGQTGVQVVAVCDVHELHYRDRKWKSKGTTYGLEPGAAAVEKHYAKQKKSGVASKCFATSDYREMLEREDIDAIVVATPDHWHARIGLDAIRSGKDVYGEKPVTHFFAEGKKLYEEVADKGAVFQVGSQQRSTENFRRAVEIVRNGCLGKIKRVEVGLPPGYNQAMDETSKQHLPPGLDYDMWCGPAEKLAYMRARHHRWWRSTRAFGGGVLMDWIGHHNDIAHWSLGEDQGGPLEVSAEGWTKSECPIYDTPAEYTIRCKYPNDIALTISTAFEQGTRWVGEDGWLWVNRGKMKAYDDRWTQKDFDPGPWRAYRSDDHVRNFVDCVKSRETCVTSAEIGHRSITPGHLGYVSNAVGRTLKWNASSETIDDDTEAQELLIKAPYRKSWSLD